MLHSTGENADKLLQFKRWFWSIVEKMSMTERQDLVSLFSGTFQCTFVERLIYASSSYSNLNYV